VVGANYPTWRRRRGRRN